MDNQQITIVIPTRNRHDTLRHSLATACNQNCDRLTILVSDNDSTPETREVVAACGDPRVRYVNTGERLSMAGNYEFALANIDCGWVVQIGDDDGFLPDRVESAVRVVEEAGLEAAATRTCHYNWPAAAMAGGTVLSVPLGQGWRTESSRRMIADGVRMNVHRFAMPQIYSGGIVNIDVVRRIRSIDGRFYHSQIPDYYSGFAISSCVDAFLVGEEPFAIAGTSKHSIGTALFKLEKNAFLDDGLIPFHADLPMPALGTLSFSMPAILVECYLQSAYLHHDPLQLQPAEILELILDETDVGRDVIEEWGRAYAAQHALDYDRAARRLGWPHWRRRISRRRAEIHNILTRYRITAGDGVEMTNVYDASVVADTILKTRPGRIGNVASTLRRLRRDRT